MVKRYHTLINQDYQTPSDVRHFCCISHCFVAIFGSACCFSSSLSGASVPDLDGLVEGGRGEQPGVRGEDHLVDQGTVAGQAGQGLLLLRRVPQEHGEVVRPRHQPLWVGALWHQKTARTEGRHG